MILPFHISFVYKRRAEPSAFNPGQYDDWSVLFRAFRQFLASYQGSFTLHIGELALRFDFEPDLSTIFEEIPDMLTQLSSEASEPAYLDFFAQGSELMLILERRNETITIQFYPDGRIAGAPAGLVVRTAEFLSEWCRFASAVLVAVAELQPDVTITGEFQDYSDRLAAVANLS